MVSRVNSAPWSKNIFGKRYLVTTLRLPFISLTELIIGNRIESENTFNCHMGVCLFSLTYVGRLAYQCGISSSFEL